MLSVLRSRERLLRLECNRAVAHAARRGDGRQEGGERGYYYLHRNLNDLFLHTLMIFLSKDFRI